MDFKSSLKRLSLIVDFKLIDKFGYQVKFIPDVSEDRIAGRIEDVDAHFPLFGFKNDVTILK